MTQKILFRHIFYLFIYLFLFVLLLNNSFNYLDSDLGWHLEAGKHVWKTGSVPEANQYNYPLQGETWVDHEWLADAFVYLLFYNGGYIAVSIFFVLVVIAVFALLHYWLLYRSYSHHSGVYLLFSFLVIWGAVAMGPHLGVRVQEITLFNLVLLLFLLEVYLFKPRTRTILWLIPLMYIWACLHGGFLIGMVFIFGFAGAKFVEWVLHRRYSPSFLQEKRILSPAVIGRYMAVALTALASTFFTPYGGKLYSFLSDYTNTFYLTHIQEWMSQYFIPFNYYQIFYIGLVLATVLLWFFYGVKWKKREYKLDLWWVALVFLLSVMAIKSCRHFPLFFVGSLPFIVFFYVKFLELKQGSHWIKFPFWLNIYLLVVFVATISSVLLSVDFTTRPFSVYCDQYPCRAVDFLKKNPEYEGRNLLARYGWGGYMIHQYPQGRLFIDGRLPQYEINDSTMLEEYYKFFKKGKVASQLKQYNVELVLLGYQEELKMDPVEQWAVDIEENDTGDSDNVLKEYLTESEKWEKIFTSDTSMIYSKK